jgi:hypothetical protein
MNKKLLLLITCNLVVLNLIFPQNVSNPFIKDMQWGIDYQIHLTLSNDSSYNLNIKDLFHTNQTTDSTSSEFVYYPVMLAGDFVRELNKNKITPDNLSNEDNNSGKNISLWSALHYSIGGGWLHFLNCLQYSLESRFLDLKAPLMVRPQTTWKPKPATASYNRIKKWKYYIPLEQKNARKEYALRAKEGQLNNLQLVPKEWIDLCLKTSQRKYDQILLHRDYKTLAKIDIVKLLLGSSYLGKAQITFIQTMVQKAILQYSVNRLPSIIVFDDIQVAVAMALDEKGYRIEKIVFKNAQDLTPEEKYNKELQVSNSIKSINLLNQKLFEKNLKRYYQ